LFATFRRVCPFQLDDIGMPFGESALAVGQQTPFSRRARSEGQASRPSRVRHIAGHLR
jgi:hypothetical protein